MAFEDIDDLLDAGLPLPYEGKTYRIAPVDGETGLRFERLKAVAAQAAKAIEDGEPLDEIGLDTIVLDDENEVDLYQTALGTVYDEMLADHVPWEVIKLAAMTVWIRTTVNRETAETYWNTAGNPDPEAVAGNRASRRGRKDPTARAGETRRLDSGAGLPADYSARVAVGVPGSRSRYR